MCALASVLASPKSAIWEWLAVCYEGDGGWGSTFITGVRGWVGLRSPRRTVLVSILRRMRY